MADKSLGKKFYNLSHSESLEIRICSGTEMYVICGKTKHTHTCLSGDGLRFQFYIQGGELGPNFTSQRCSEKMEPGSGMEPDYQDTSQNRRWINSQKIGFL